MDPEPEQVVWCRDEATGLRAVIAIHSTALGPSCGGTRFRPYASEDEALSDVLRLAEGMTYKHAACGNDLGGGKGVIIGDRPPCRGLGHRQGRARARRAPARRGGARHRG